MKKREKEGQCFSFRSNLVDNGILSIHDFSKVEESQHRASQTVSSLNKFLSSVTKEQIQGFFRNMKKKFQKLRVKDCQNCRTQYLTSKRYKQPKSSPNGNLILGHKENEKLKLYIKKIMQENKQIKNGFSPQQTFSHQRNNSATNTKDKVKLPSYTYNLEQTEEFAWQIMNGQSKTCKKPYHRPIKSYTSTSSLLQKSNSPSQNGNQKVFERLYSDFSVQKQVKEQKEVKKQFKELEDCTFQPDLSQTIQSSRKYLNSRDKSTTFSDNQSVYERLSVDRKQTYQILQQQKEQNELENCTFQPELLTKNEQILAERKFNTYEKLYSDYNKYQETIRLKQQDKIKNELNGCTFQPFRSVRAIDTLTSEEQLNSEEVPMSEKVFNRLYNTFDKQRNKKIQLSQKVNNQVMKECTFSPQIQRKSFDRGSSSKSQRSESPYERLYEYRNTKEKNLQKLRDDIYKQYINENKKQSYTKKKKQPEQKNHKRNNSSGNIYERLFQEKKELAQKKKDLVLKFLKDSGFNFIPNADKNKKPQAQDTSLLTNSFKIMNKLTNNTQETQENSQNANQQQDQNSVFVPKNESGPIGIIARLYSFAQLKNKKEKFVAEKKEEKFKF